MTEAVTAVLRRCLARSRRREVKDEERSIGSAIARKKDVCSQQTIWRQGETDGDEVWHKEPEQQRYAQSLKAQDVKAGNDAVSGP